MSVCVDAIAPLATCPLAIEVDEVLVGWPGAPQLFTGHSLGGHRWVAAQMENGDRWLCAPASELAIRCLCSGRATVVDLFRHSTTATVDEIVLGPDGRCAHSLRLCQDLRADELVTLSLHDLRDVCA